MARDRGWVHGVVSVVLILAATALLPPAAPAEVPLLVGYQGRLLDSAGNPVEGTRTVTFSIHDAATDGNLLWSETQADVAVSGGIFSTSLGKVSAMDPANVSGGTLWLGVAVAPDGEMTPRQRISSTAFSLRAGISDAAAPGSVGTSGLSDNAVTSAKLGQGAVTAAKIGVPCAEGEILKRAGGEWVCAADNATGYLVGTGLLSDGPILALDNAFADARYWRTGGNGGTTPGTHYVGTSDDRALEIRVNGLRALRIEPHATSPNVIGGEPANYLAAGVYGATIGGGGQGGGNPNRVTGNHGTVGGGMNNAAANSATVGGGLGARAVGFASTVGGGSTNSAGGFFATVAGGYNDNANGFGATVGGGAYNYADNDYATVAGGYNDNATGYATTVGGGWGNHASNSYVTIAGGRSNTAAGWYSTIGGGYDNRSSDNASTVGGGRLNESRGQFSVVAGGYGNAAVADYSAVGGGNGNAASGFEGTVSGGGSNSASGRNSAVPGGSNNLASGSYSFAAGRNARATDNGSFVWGDSSPAVVSSSAVDQFTVRASGGVRLFSDASSTTGVSLAPGGGSWSSVSDRGLKENFAPADGLEVLGKVASLPVSSWNLRTQDPAVRHMGPTAQDFRAAFGLGENDRTINGTDADGVALAAIQGLYRLATEQAERIRKQSESIDRLLSAREADASRVRELEDGRDRDARRIRDLESRLSAVELAVNPVASASEGGAVRP